MWEVGRGVFLLGAVTAFCFGDDDEEMNAPFPDIPDDDNDDKSSQNPSRQQLLFLSDSLDLPHFSVALCLV